MDTSEQGLRHTDQPGPPGENPPPPPPPNVKLQFNVVISDKTGALTYELQPTDAFSGPYLKGSTIDLPNGPDWYDIIFHVVDQVPSQKIIYDLKEPICAQLNGGCPNKGSGIKTNNQLSQVDRQDRKLTLLNRNQDPPVQIGYTLFFIDENSKQPIDPPFDPIMDNGGGGRI